MSLDKLDHRNDKLDHRNDKLDHRNDKLDHRSEKKVVMVAAVAENGVIGLGGDIPWSIPEDLKHFRAVTRGNTVVMGRRTFESIGHPLPYRTNVVVTRNQQWTYDGVFVTSSVDDAIELAQEFEGDVMVIGGAQVYEAAMSRADAQILTEVRLSPEGDTHYPDFDRADWHEVKRESHDGFDFVWWERRADPYVAEARTVRGSDEADG